MTELKPCPFCGGKAILDRHDVFCFDCNAKIEIAPFIHSKESINGFPTYEQARQEMVEAWNRRVNDA